MAYTFEDWLTPWLEQVETTIADALGGNSDMAYAVSSHFEGVRGKRLRPALTLMSAGVSGTIPEHTVKLAAGIELIHLATLVHDDVVDGAAVRRGRPTPNAKWGIDWAILTGDFIFARAFALLAELSNPQIISSLSSAISYMCEGEWDQLKGRYGEDITSEEYEARISGKTAAFMGSCCECGAILASSSELAVDSLRRYGHGVGMAFQIADDYLDYAGDTVTMGKPVNEDLASGVYTLPLIYALDEHRDELVELLRNAEEGSEQIEQISDIVRSSSGLPRSLERAREYVSSALENLEYLSDSPAKSSLIRLASYACDRRS